MSTPPMAKKEITGAGISLKKDIPPTNKIHPINK